MTILTEPLVLRARPALHFSDDEFFEFCRQNRDLRIEQTAAGEWIIMPPTGFETGSRNSEVSRQLGNWARQDDTGVALDSSTGYVLPNGAKRSPDASWVLRSRLAGLTPSSGGFMSIGPASSRTCRTRPRPCRRTRNCPASLWIRLMSGSRVSDTGENTT